MESRERTPGAARIIAKAGGGGPAARFEDWMRVALYDPDLGYYAQNVRSVGPRGDFSTAATLHPALGEAVAAWASARRKEPIIYVNCAALPETLAEAELFGHVRGSFTGAAGDRPGKFEIADGGTLFLDEIGELPLTVQPKLLRALQEGEIQRVGADRPIRVDVRLLAATNRDLTSEVAAGRFRADLFHRLNVYPLEVPPLRDRTDDIPLLAGYFCDVARRRSGAGPVRLDASAAEALTGYAWPGNVRELENVISRAVLRRVSSTPRGQAIVISAQHLEADVGRSPVILSVAPAAEPDRPRENRLSLKDSSRVHRRERIAAALAEHGSFAAAARALGMDRGNFHRLAKKLGL